MLVQRLLYAIARYFTLAYTHLLLEGSIQWNAPLPEGPKLLVANHPSFSDPLLFTLLSKQPMSVLITATAFLIPLLGLYLRKSRHIPVVEDQGRPAYDEALARLKEGKTVALFIEGTYSPPTGGYWPPRTGAVRMALEAGVPIVPVGIHLVREKLHLIHGKIKGQTYPQYWYLRGPFHITVGEPITVAGDIENRPHVVAESNRIMHHVIELAEESKHRLQERLCQKAYRGHNENRKLVIRNQESEIGTQ